VTLNQYFACIAVEFALMCTMVYSCKLRRFISNQLDMLQDSQRERSLVYSSQQMSV